MQETPVPSLGQQDPPGEGNVYSFQYSCLENSTDRGVWWAAVHGISKSQTCPSDSHFCFSECLRFAPYVSKLLHEALFLCQIFVSLVGRAEFPDVRPTLFPPRPLPQSCFFFFFEIIKEQGTVSPFVTGIPSPFLGQTL